MVKHNPKNIVISRTDSIGDVVLTLPLAGILKKTFPLARIIFLGNTYTRPIIQCSEHVDEVWEWVEIQKMDYNDQVDWLKTQHVDTFIHIFPRKEIARLAKKADIPVRIGTSHRLFHLLTVNKPVNFTRKRSDLHEAQLNTKLLAPLGIKKSYSLKDLYEFVGFKNMPILPDSLANFLDENRINVILHPKSQGSAVEWGVDQFMELATELNEAKFKVFITGTEKEAESFRSKIPQKENVVDLSGKMTLDELISFIFQADVLVAASTGPLHIAGVCGIHAIGLFANKKPIHPGRWKPLGNTVTILTSEKNSDPSQPLSIILRDVKKAVESTVKR